MKNKRPKLAYEFLKAKIHNNRAFRNLTSDDIDFIIYNQLKQIAEHRGWIKKAPVSVFQHK